MVGGIENKETYTVSEGYFNNITFNNNRKSAKKVIAINKKNKVIFKSCGCGCNYRFVGLSIVNIVDRNNPQTTIKNNCRKLLPVQTKPNTVLMNGSFDEASCKMFQDNEIEQYLQK
jgi:beta-lactamase superfamily II metal-dependent hydrolase